MPPPWEQLPPRRAVAARALLRHPDAAAAGAGPPGPRARAGVSSSFFDAKDAGGSSGSDPVGLAKGAAVFACGARHDGKRAHRDAPASAAAVAAPLVGHAVDGSAGGAESGGASTAAAAAARGPANPRSLSAGDAMLNHGYAFEGLCWARARLRVFQLRKVWRQSDELFVAALNELRAGERRGPMLRRVLDATRRPLVDDGSGIKPTVLFPVNRSVDGYNRLELSRLAGPEFAFMARRRVAPEVEAPESPEQFQLQAAQVRLLAREKYLAEGQLVPRRLELRIGAQVR